MMELLLDGGGIFLTPQLTNNLTISTASANTLAEAFKPLLQQSEQQKFLLLAVAVLSLITAMVTGYVAYSSYKTSKNAFVNGILKQFFDISMSFPLNKGGTLSAHHKQLMCNYFEFVCYLIEKGQLKENDIDPLTAAMRQPLFVNFMKQYRKGKGRKPFFEVYWRWYQKNK